MANTEMVIDSIRVSLMNYQRVVILKEKEGERYLPIWIGTAEADSIAVKMQGISVPRPLTHDFLCSIANVAGLKIKSVVMNKLENDTYYAKAVVTSGGKSYEIDCRPSDALAIAVRVSVPIFADEKVLNKASILLDAETGKPIDPETRKPIEAGVGFYEEGKPTELTSQKIESIENELGKKPPQIEIFSESARDIMSLAEEEAKCLNHNFVGTGHLLLALVKKIPTVANRVLNNLGINLAKIPAEIEVSINQQLNIESGESGLTSAAKKAIELSIIEIKRLGGGKVQPEHILIGLIRQNEGVAANLLKNLGIDPEKIYIELIRLYTQPWHQQQSQSS